MRHNFEGDPRYQSTGTVCAWLFVIFVAWIVTYRWELVAAAYSGPRAIIGLSTVVLVLLARRFG